MTKMIKTLAQLLILSCCMTNVIAAPSLTIDIYGTDKLNKALIKKRYRKTIIDFYQGLKMNMTQAEQKAFSQTQNRFKKMLAWMRTQGDFALLETSRLSYSNHPGVYFSIDVVESADKKRLSYFRPAPKGDIADPEHLIASWEAYENIGFRMIMNAHRYPKKFKHCPAFHCSWGFEEAAFKPYEAIFMNKVPKHQATLETILREDKNEKKRASAAYLLAHIQNGDELIADLTPAMFDHSSAVRNAALRVLGETVLVYHPKSFPIDSLVTALDFPITTDRNKAIFTLDSLSKNPAFQAEIRRKAAPQVLKLLHSTQPNIHDFAYAILKRLSHKQFGARDYASWQQWMTAQQHKTAQKKRA